ncbi:MAG: hypothetical protein HYT87_00465 [Nitrospirae bacterium]|nr:hypothetical protein [Nitrospirota bacterium]
MGPSTGRGLIAAFTSLFLLLDAPSYGISENADERKAPDSSESPLEKIGAEYGVKPGRRDPPPRSFPAAPKEKEPGTSGQGSDAGGWVELVGKVLEEVTDSKESEEESHGGREEPSSKKVSSSGVFKFNKTYRHPWRRDLRAEALSSSRISGVGVSAAVRKIGGFGIEAESFSLADRGPGSQSELLLLGAHPFASLSPHRFVEVLVGAGFYNGSKTLSGKDSRTGPSALFRLIALPYTPWTLEAGLESSRIGGRFLYEPKLNLGVKLFPFSVSATSRNLLTPSQNIHLLGVTFGTSF